jgi:hypothetical protein
MKTGQALSSGMALVQRYIKIVPLIYTFNLVLALILTIPLFTTLQDDFGRHEIRTEWVSGFGMDWWASLDLETAGLEKTVQPSLTSGWGRTLEAIEPVLTGRVEPLGIWILVMAVVYLVVSAFLNGGLVAFFADEKRDFTIQRYFSFSSYYFHHFIALATTAVLAFALLYWFVVPAWFDLIGALTTDTSSGMMRTLLHLLGYAIWFFILILIDMIFDYAKFILVDQKKESAWASIGLAATFVVGHLGQTLRLYCLLVALAVVLTLGMAGLESVLPQGQFFLILVIVLIHQVFLLAKIWLRLVFYGSQFRLYQQARKQVRTLRKV